jgi:DNA-binding response OmpR family regulator
VEQIGVDDFLLKPFGIEALTTAVENVVAGKAPVKQGLSEGSLEGKRDGVPKARLLFVEPSEFTFKLKEVFFSNRERCQGDYELASAYLAEEALHRLDSFRPDILLVDLSVLGPAGELVVKALSSPSRPKELIVHGSGTALPPGQNAKVEDWTRQGVRVVYNESFTQAGLARLASVIRNTAIANGLIQAA